MAKLATKAGPDDLPHPMENVKPDNWQDKFEGRVKSKFVDPCDRAAKASLECMNRNDYDRNQCLDFFQAYRDCKKEWLDQRNADRRAGRV
ncbi:hypothetical protein C8Q72DRAFT_886381 [Fomitopsis betulina]|nr:hypothetical protein C8Q72DRAFT_886381 [Fomitopsis betulina]